MPTLPEYPGVSQVQTESPTLPYGSPIQRIQRKAHRIHFLDIFWPILEIQLADFHQQVFLGSKNGKIGDLLDFDFFRLASLNVHVGRC